MAIMYIVACLSVLVSNADQLLNAITLVVTSAFTSTAATRWFLGASIAAAIQSGIARGVFSNESGLGSAQWRRRRQKRTRCVKQDLSL